MHTQIEELSKVGLTAFPFLTSHADALDCFMTGGTCEQRREYLSRLLAGEFFAFVLTEPNAGSDVASMQTKAVPQGNKYIFQFNVMDKDIDAQKHPAKYA